MTRHRRRLLPGTARDGRAIGRPARVLAALVATAFGALGASGPGIASAGAAAAGPAGSVTPGRPALPGRQALAGGLATPRPLTPLAGPWRPPFARPKLPAEQQYACQAPSRPGQLTCMSIVQTAPAAAARAAAAAFRGYGPSALRKAYRLNAAAAWPIRAWADRARRSPCRTATASGTRSGA